MGSACSIDALTCSVLHLQCAHALSMLQSRLRELQVHQGALAHLRSERPVGDYVASLGKGGRQKLLRALARRLDRQRFTQGRIQHILHARVPILKFACAKTGACLLP